MKTIILCAALLALSPIVQANPTQDLQLVNQTDLVLSIATLARYKTGEETLTSLCYAVGVGEVALTTANIMKFDLSNLFQSFGANQKDFSAELKKKLQLCLNPVPNQ